MLSIFWASIFVLARLSYVGYVWLALIRRQKTNLTHAKFKRRAAWAMNIDVIVFIIAVFFLRGEINTDYNWLLQVLGAILVIFGLGVKYAAFRILGKDGYYWKNFFTDDVEFKGGGVYKYFKDPMYGPGYLSAYGWALINLSFTGLILSAFSQATIMTFHYFVERPHFQKTYNRRQKFTIMYDSE